MKEVKEVNEGRRKEGKKERNGKGIDRWASLLSNHGLGLLSVPNHAKMS